MKGNRTFSDIITLRTVLTLIHSLTLIASIILFVCGELNPNQDVTNASVICSGISVIVLSFAVNCDSDDIISGVIMVIEIAVAVIIFIAHMITFTFTTVSDFSVNDCWFAIGNGSYLALGSIAIGVVIGKIAGCTSH